MRYSVRWRYLLGFGVLLLVLAVVGIAAYRTASAAAAGVRESRGAGDELIRFGELLSRMDEEQAAVSGFVITGQTFSLALRDSALPRLPVLLRELKVLAGGDTLERRSLDSLEVLVGKRIAYGSELIRIRSTEGASAAAVAVSVGPGARLSDAIRSRVRDLERAHVLERERQLAELLAGAHATRWVVVAGWLVALFSVAVASLLAHRGLASRERADAQARELADELQDLYDHAPVGYHSLDAHGLLVRMNETELEWLGYAREEIVGRMRFADLLAPASREGFEINFERFKATGTSRDQAYNLFRKNGTILPILLNASVVRDAAGRYVMSREVSVDVTERRRMEAQVQTLSGLLPICASCKKIRDDRGYWNRIETYISEHSQAEFSHGLCPDCLERLYPELAEKPVP
jgi:PAS domain S-box-containing protein